MKTCLKLQGNWIPQKIPFGDFLSLPVLAFGTLFQYSNFAFFDLYTLLGTFKLCHLKANLS
jgi:hypothetical protein